MAWLALGWVPELTAAKALVRPRAVVEPDPETHQLYLGHLKKADRILQAVKAARD
jgi:hypothetical protein